MLFTLPSSFLFSASILASLSRSSVVVAVAGPGIRVPFDRSAPPPPDGDPDEDAVPAEFVPRGGLDALR